MILELELTEEMMGRLMKKANKYAVEPADVAKMILAHELSRDVEPCWFDKLSNVATRVTDAVIAISKMEAPKEK